MRKKYKRWSWQYNESNESVDILVEDTKIGWVSIATISECPKGDMTNEEFEKKHVNTFTDIIEDLGYTLA